MPPDQLQGHFACDGGSEGGGKEWDGTSVGRGDISYSPRILSSHVLLSYEPRRLRRGNRRSGQVDVAGRGDADRGLVPGSKRRCGGGPRRGVGVEVVEEVQGGAFIRAVRTQHRTLLVVNFPHETPREGCIGESPRQPRYHNEA